MYVLQVLQVEKLLLQLQEIFLAAKKEDLNILLCCRIKFIAREDTSAFKSRFEIGFKNATAS